ncbi:MAG: sulfatase-like hydrolase/transferase [Planctomycetota bacterium]
MKQIVAIAFLLATGLLARFAPAATHPSVDPEPTARPNVIVLIVDDLGYDDVGFHGGAVRTPVIDRMARTGLELTRFYAYPVCAPSRAAIMTGRTLERMGETKNLLYDGGLSLDERLMPQAFGDAGYQTWLVGKWHLGGSVNPAHLPHRRGFDTFYGFLGGTVDAYEHVQPRRQIPDWQRNGEQIREQGYCTDLLTDEAVRLIEGRDDERPFFLVLSFRAVHRPLQPPPGTTADGMSRRALYVAMVEHLDQAIGRVIETLEREAITEKTLLLFLSDNGGRQAPRGAASNAPWRGGKRTMLEGGIRVPAVLSWPGVIEGNRRSDQPISVLDIFPTLAAAAHVDPGVAQPLDGVNLWPALMRGEIVERPPLAISHDGAAVIDGRWKLIRKPNGRLVLYDLEDDVREETNLAAARPDVVERLFPLLPSPRPLVSDAAAD